MKSTLLVFLSLFLYTFAIPFHSYSLNDQHSRRDVLSYLGDCKTLPHLSERNTIPSLLSVHPWIPASLIRNSVRSPCPLLNTLANHGFLARDGRNLTVAKFQAGIVDAINFSPDFAKQLAENNFKLLAPLLNFDPQDPNVAIDLEQLNAHNRTEHDQSMTRLDAIQGDTLHVQDFMVQQLTHDTTPIAYQFLNTSSLGRTRLRRMKESLGVGSPPLIKSQVQACYAEASLVVVLLGVDKGQDPDARSIRKESAVEWFKYERFPRGWRRSERVIPIGDMNLYSKRILHYANIFNGLNCGNEGGEEELGKC